MKSLAHLLLAVLWCFNAAGAEPPAARPNIIFMIADDLGYGDLGCYGQKHIRTPNLDRLATQGIRFTRHYSGNAVCAPSRCVLMTGKHPGHAFIRDNKEVKAGYVTGAFGKWGLGSPGSAGDPLNQGFDRFYGYNCQREAHNHYPTHLWDDRVRVALPNAEFSPHQKLPPGADPSSPESYRQYASKAYAPDLISEQARRFIRDNKDRPFFLFYPTTVPHLALQVPSDSLAEYQGKFSDQPYTGARSYLPHPSPRAAYAAMVTRMDREIGSFVKLVEDLSLGERTLFVFTSDNGPLYDKLGGTDAEFFNSAGPLKGRKGSLYEGGIRVPLIVRWTGRIAAGATCDRVTGFEDWMPTLLELAGLTRPSGIDGISFWPSLMGKAQEPRPFLYREFPGYRGQQSILAGNWKLVRSELAGPKPQTQLFDLEADPSEARDVSSQNPGVLARLLQLMNSQHAPSREFPFPALDKAIEAKAN
jgi:arylsulfatase